MKKILEYSPDFFILTPVLVWIVAYLSKNPFIEKMFLQMHWWMIFGIVLYTNNILIDRTKNFL